MECMTGEFSFWRGGTDGLDRGAERKFGGCRCIDIECILASHFFLSLSLSLRVVGINIIMRYVSAMNLVRLFLFFFFFLGR